MTFGTCGHEIAIRIIPFIVHSATFGTCGHEIAIRVIPFIVHSAISFSFCEIHSFIDLEIKMGFRVMVITIVTPPLAFCLTSIQGGKGHTERNLYSVPKQSPS